MEPNIKRYLFSFLKRDLKEKILFITGPRQCGKTTLAKSLGESFDYFNYDEGEDRKALSQRSWDRKKEYVIFDELHKMKDWKRWLKGVYDTEGLSPGIVVTGSAKLDTYKKGGDSLAGRFFQFRLHPLDLKEVHDVRLMKVKEALKRILQFGGFPEPFLKSKKAFYGRWKRSHLDIVLRQDILDLENVRAISSIQTLVQLLRDRVGSPLSYTSLSEDLNCAPKTVKHWIEILESLYIIFKITPWHRNIARSLLKAPKIYFYDIAHVPEFSFRFENLVACALLKELHFREDVKGEEWGLFYLRNKEKKEVDFLISKGRFPVCMVEVKVSEDQETSSLRSFSKMFSNDIQKVQLVKNPKREKTFPDGVEVRDAGSWLSQLGF